MSTRNQTTTAGDEQHLGRFMLAAGPTSGLPGVLKLQTISAAGTRTTRNVWMSSAGRLRWVSGSEPTNELTGGADVTASLPAGTVTPTMASDTLDALVIPVPLAAQAGGASIPNGSAAYSGTLTLAQGAGYILNTGTISASSAYPTTIGLGTTAAKNLLYKTFTSTVAAGTVSTMTAGSVTSVAVQRRVRLDITQGVSGVSKASFPTGGTLIWVPRKTGA